MIYPPYLIIRAVAGEKLLIYRTFRRIGVGSAICKRCLTFCFPLSHLGYSSKLDSSRFGAGSRTSRAQALRRLHLWREKCILAGDIELVVVYVVQEHIDTAEVIGGKVNLLTIETLTNIVLAEYLCRFQEQRTRTASRVIYLIDFGLGSFLGYFWAVFGQKMTDWTAQSVIVNR